MLEKGKAEKDRGKVEKALILLTTTYNKMHDELLRNIETRIQKVKEKHAFGSSCFLGLYIFGTLFIAFGSAKSWIGWKKK